MSGVLRLAATPDWRDLAACRGMDQGIFYPELGANPNAARRVCEQCSVVDDCREFALAIEARLPLSHGVFGALAPHERRDIINERKRQAA